MNKAKFVIEQTQKFSKEINGKTIDPSKIVIDSYAPFDNNFLGRNTISSKTGDIIIYDRYFIEHADDDLIMALIVHECCHFQLKEHRTEDGKEIFQKLFNCYYHGSFDVSKRPTFEEFLIKLKRLNIFDGVSWKESIPQPTDLRVRKLLEYEGVVFNKEDLNKQIF